MENKDYTQEELTKAMNKLFKTPEERMQIRLIKESVYGNVIDPELISKRNRNIDLWIISRAKRMEDMEK